MTQTLTPTPQRRDVGPPRRRHPLTIDARTSGGLIVKIVSLGLVLALAIALTPTLVATANWAFLALLWATVLVVVAVYLTGRVVPAKYLLPGVLMLVLFLIYPIVLTFQLSTTNYSDGTRSSKDAAIARIVGTSAVQVEGGAVYSLVVGTQGATTTGPFEMLLVDAATEQAFVGSEEEGLTELPADAVTIEAGTITAADGYTILTRQEQNDLSGSGQPLDGFAVPVDDDTVIKAQGFQAIEMRTPLIYDEDADTITNDDTGVVYTAERAPSGDRSYFVDPDGQRLATQSWSENVGLFNFERVFSDQRITGPFISILGWTIVFAVGSVGSTFLLGLFLATTLNETRMRGQRAFRSFLIMPYAIPGFISLMVWAGFWNRDYGLVNDMLGTGIDWFGDATWAKVAVLLTNLWMGFPYMFLICTGALQSIPSDLKEAAAIDGATGFGQFRRVVFPSCSSRRRRCSCPRSRSTSTTSTRSSCSRRAARSRPTTRRRAAPTSSSATPTGSRSAAAGRRSVSPRPSRCCCSSSRACSPPSSSAGPASSRR
ncbi:ABC transporter permease subunit [Litorihabitans aurantiacus]|uniref:Maltose/maltodextrin transport system permease protein n=1 Tax=Litorihabitans aurantiacus TaxID=1930061 RepID=A0AA37XDT2_9MICO|nr:ABC transporter permease subunit [Litorihabitans aurantiacus]GMA30992.1 sugar ABC transporter permease [Litorihabitans aurantiacus]